MARKAMRAAKPLGWVALGWVLAALYILGPRTALNRGPDLGYFEELGKRGFELAAEHRIAEQYGLSDLYAAVAARFGLLRVALNTLSDTLLFPNVNTPERLMRQVADEARWKLAG